MQPLKIGFIHNAFPVLSETFISKEMTGLQQRGLDLNIYSLFRPEPSRLDRSYSGDSIFYLIPNLKPWRLLISHIIMWVVSPKRYWDTLKFAWLKRNRQSSLLNKMLSFQSGKTMSREERQDLLLHFILAAPLAKQMRADHITLINSHFADAAASFAMLCGMLLGIDYGITAHAYDIFTPQFHMPEKLSRSRFILTCTQYNKKAFEKDYSALAEKVFVFYHGINTTKFKRKSNPQNSVFQIFSVGRLVSKKGFDVLINACAELKNRGVKFNCQIVGDGPLQEKLQFQIEQYDLNGEVTLLGAKPSTEIPAYYERADVFALPCVVEPDGNRDGIPNVIAEAMAMQLPVVSTIVSGIPELVQHEETGLLLKEHDHVGLADALQKLSEDTSLREKMGQAGRARVQEIFDSEVCLDRLYEFYQHEWQREGSS